ncbi:MAG TPA: magnesium transporter [Firmicutes bacterium]|nr:magnesium transporter [Bacillota bacterium]
MPITYPSSLANNLRPLLLEGATTRIADLLEDLQPYDLFLLLKEFNYEEQLLLLGALSADTAAETLEYLEPYQQYSLLDHLPLATKTEILNEMSSDVITQLFTAIHPRQAEQLMAALQDRYRERIDELMLYPENTAGSLANIDYIAAREWWSVEQTIGHIRKIGNKAEIIAYIYVLGSLGQLVGVLSLRELIMAPPESSLEEIMTTNVIFVPAEEDQEHAARLLAHYDLVALPVVNVAEQMVGIITVDDVLDVIEDEATEDIQLLGGSQPLDSPYLHASFFSLFQKRIVWLLLLFIVETLTGSILKHYEQFLSQVVALTFFIPLLIDTGGNAGSQASTLVIRAMAVGEVTAKDFLKIIWREMRLGLALGMAMAVATLIFVRFLHGSIYLGLTVSTTVVLVVTISSSIGAILPIIGKRLGVDPAVFSAPMITTVVDASGLIIYFLLARWILGLA